MTVALAATYHPRGELSRLRRLWPLMQAVYSVIIISLPPTAAQDDVEIISRLPDVRVWVNADWSHGRYMSLKLALDTDARAVHYADLDRLLRWIETRPGEWRLAVECVERCEGLVIGRTPAAWDTHPQALRQTERISNTLFSHLLGQELDLSAGSKGFSRLAVEYIIANSRPERALGADGEWPVLLHRGGFRLESLWVDGLDWESADRYQDRAADRDTQLERAAAYDADPAHWAMRVGVAQEIVAAGLSALTRELNEDW